MNTFSETDELAAVKAGVERLNPDVVLNNGHALWRDTNAFAFVTTDSIMSTQRPPQEWRTGLSHRLHSHLRAGSAVRRPLPLRQR